MCDAADRQAASRSRGSNTRPGSGARQSASGRSAVTASPSSRPRGRPTPSSRASSTRDLLVARRELDVRRALDAAPQQLDLRGADAAADLEQRRDPLAREELDRVAGVVLEPLRAPALQVAARLPCVEHRRRTRAASSSRPRGRRYPGPLRMSDYVFTMVRAEKFYGPERKVLDEHHARLPAGREDRRARAERRRQVDAAADHGRARGAVERQAPSSRPARPSACSSRSRSSTPPRTCAGTSRTASAPLRDLLDRFNAISAAVRRARRRLRRAARRAGEGAGADRPRRRLEPRRRRSTARWTRCGCPTATAT